MRYKHKLKPYPNIGDKREFRNRFLLFPKTINGETRWLERASWTETFIPDGPYIWFPPRWLSDEWIKEGETT